MCWEHCHHHTTHDKNYLKVRSDFIATHISSSTNEGFGAVPQRSTNEEQVHSQCSCFWAKLPTRKILGSISRWSGKYGQSQTVKTITVVWGFVYPNSRLILMISHEHYLWTRKPRNPSPIYSKGRWTSLWLIGNTSRQWKGFKVVERLRRRKGNRCTQFVPHFSVFPGNDWLDKAVQPLNIALNSVILTFKIKLPKWTDERDVQDGTSPEEASSCFHIPGYRSYRTLHYWWRWSVNWWSISRNLLSWAMYVFIPHRRLIWQPRSNDLLSLLCDFMRYMAPSRKWPMRYVSLLTSLCFCKSFSLQEPFWRNFTRMYGLHKDILTIIKGRQEL